MGYGLLGKFVDKTSRKVVATYNMDFLKNLNDCGYSSTFTDIDTTSQTTDKDFPALCETKCLSFKGLYEREVLNVLEKKGVKCEKCESAWGSGPNYESYVVLSEENDSYDKITELIEDYIIIKVTSDVMETASAVAIMYITTEKSFGTWYTYADVKAGLGKIKKKHDDAQDDLSRLKQIKNSVQYFEMSENAKNDLLSEIGWAEDTEYEYSYQLESINLLECIFESIKNNLLYITHDKYGIEHSSSNWEDKRNIELRIEVI